MPATLVLRCVAGLGNIGAARLIATHGGAAAAVESLDAGVRAEAVGRAREVSGRCDASGLVPVGCDDPRYPPSLRALEDPPVVLFCLGNVALLDLPSVAVVGTRQPTGYGLRVTRRMVRGLVEGGVGIVSGLARGIDAAAHEEALDAAGTTVAVLGTGADVCYPRENARLYARVAADGVVVSEVLPGSPALPGAFPRRNRLVAALADVTLVVEAGAKSGALITAQRAAAIGRAIAAVPGPVDVESARGSNGLLQDGGHVVTGPEDALALLDLTARGRTRVARARQGRTPTDGTHPVVEGRILEVLAREGARADELVQHLELPVPEVAAALASLELRGMVEVDAAGVVYRR